MTRPKETRKMNDSGSGGGNSTTIDDLDDNMLTQILFRLPSCATVLPCKLVNKHWCYLISDPKFGAHYSNHKKENSDEPPPWTFVSNKIDSNANEVPQYQYCVGNGSANEAIFGSPKFSLGFLPCKFFHIEATFMDLVLCSSHVTSPRGDWIFIYFLANPLTKQWVALPPRPVFFNQLSLQPFVTLVGQQPSDYTQDYKFRVVVIDHCPPPVYQLLVYCSEIGVWKRFYLIISINPELAAQNHLYYNNKFQSVVCNGIIYFHHKLYFAAFNPFDVDETTETTTIEAKVLPSLPYPIDGYLRESSGQLFIIHSLKKRRSLWYDKRGRTIELRLMVCKLDPNQVPLIWKTTFEGSCSGNVIEPPYDDYSGYDMKVWNIGMHPNNDKLIYVHLWREHQFFCCDTRTKLIKSLKNLSPIYNLETFDRLELQWWPTSVPKAYLS